MHWIQLLLDHHHCSYTCISFAHLMGPDQTAELTQCAKPSVPCNSLVDSYQTCKPVWNNRAGLDSLVPILRRLFYCRWYHVSTVQQYTWSYLSSSAFFHSNWNCCPLANYHTLVKTASGKLLAPRWPLGEVLISSDGRSSGAPWWKRKVWCFINHYWHSLGHLQIKGCPTFQNQSFWHFNQLKTIRTFQKV